MSTNISGEKREALLSKIAQIKSFIEQNAKDENASQLLSFLGDLSKEVNGKKYGLVFEEHREKIDEILEQNAPVFTEEKDLFIDGGGELNFLLEGDNLASLKLLEKTHRGKIDVIYIDPPYNTGLKPIDGGFKYDDSFVESEDSFKHSKWISFMSKRLTIARELLANNGIIFISINEIEQAQLKLICDDIFGQENLLCVFHIQTRYPEKDVANNGAEWLPIIEYVFIYAKKIMEFKLNRPTENYNFSPYHFNVIEKQSSSLIDMNGKKVEIFKKGSYEIINNKEADKDSLKEVWASGNLLKQKNTAAWYYNEYLLSRLEEDGTDTLYKIYGIGEDGLGYRYVKGPSKLDKTRGKIYQGAPLSKKGDFAEALKYKPILSFYDFSPDFGNINSEGGVSFGSGKKPVKMLKQFINYHKGKDITVLDFFAGSGSTGHATLALNEEDGGSRKFILCTNNENNICHDITYQRIKNVITEDNLPGSLKYFKTDFIPISEKMYYEYADELLLHVRELVELENAVNFDKDDSVTIVLDDDEMEEFVTKIVGSSPTMTEEHVKTLYMGHDVLLSSKQERILKAHNITVNVIPDYYYRDLAL
jgi:adenine-specific DNA-methyltransferase